MAPMKTFVLISLLIFTILVGGCTTKTYEYISHISFPGTQKDEKPAIKNKILYEIANLIKTDTNASLQIAGTPSIHTPEGINLYVTNEYLKISFTLTQMFIRTGSTLNEETIRYIQKIIPILHKYPHTIIQIVGHAYDEGTPKKCSPDKPHLLCSAQNRRVDLFIYTNKDDVITKCR